MYSKIYFSTLGLIEIIDIPLILTVMLCSDSEVTCGVGGGGGGGQFHTFKSRPYHTRKPPSLSFTVLMPMPHAHLKAGSNVEDQEVSRKVLGRTHIQTHV